jgi:hypothetical protein
VFMNFLTTRQNRDRRQPMDWLDRVDAAQARLRRSPSRPWPRPAEPPTEDARVKVLDQACDAIMRSRSIPVSEERDATKKDPAQPVHYFRPAV